LAVDIGVAIALPLGLLFEHLSHQRWTPRPTWFVGFVVILVAFLDNCWLPSERVETANGTRSAYVLSADSDRVVLLSTGRREVSIFSNDEVKARSICHISRPITGLLRVRGLSVLWSLGNQPEYKKCPGD
jgi:hypothetical protein